MSEKRIVCIKDSPLIDYVLEFRFAATLDTSLIPMSITQLLEISPESLERLPTQSIPEDVRSRDPNLMFLPLFKYEGNSSIFMFGPRSFSIAAKMPYKSWKVFESEVSKYAGAFLEKSWVKSIDRIGLRATNFFEKNVLPSLNYRISLPDVLGRLEHVQYQHLEIFKKGNYFARINLVNNALIQIKSTHKSGSILDLDAYCEAPGPKSQDSLFKVSKDLHDFQKEIFFSILSESEIQSRAPIYA